MGSYFYVQCVAQTLVLANNGNWLLAKYRTLLQYPYKDSTPNMSSILPHPTSIFTEKSCTSLVWFFKYLNPATKKGEVEVHTMNRQTAKTVILQIRKKSNFHAFWIGSTPSGNINIFILMQVLTIIIGLTSSSRT